MWLLDQSANRTLKQNAQTQHADAIQAFFYILYDTIRIFISTTTLLIDWGRRCSELPASYVSAEAPATRHAAL